MRDILRLVIHVLTTIVKLLRPGGARAIVRRIPGSQTSIAHHEPLTQTCATSHRVGPSSFGSGYARRHPKRLCKLAVIVKPKTLLKFHQALKRHKYRLLFSSSRQRRPGPTGPSRELIAAIVEMKRRNPKFGCPRIAQQISYAF